MAYTFNLPDIGEGLEEAEIILWLVAPGDKVERDQPLVEVLTDKANSELPSPVAGTVLRLGAAEGERLQVGDLLIELDDDSSDGDNTPEEAPSSSKTPIIEAPEEAPSSSKTPIIEAPEEAPSTKTEPTSRVKASPATRKLARELEIELSKVAGTGPGGRITHDDVRAAAPPVSQDQPLQIPTTPSKTSPGSQTSGLGKMPPGRHPLRGIRGVVARNMAQSWSDIPHIHSIDEIDATLLMDLRTRICAMNRPGASAVTPLTITAAATARALCHYPMVNGCIEGTPMDTILIQSTVNLGIATATPNGLVVPVVQNADRLDLFTLATAIADLVSTARAGKLTTNDLMGATFTITNYGALGGRWALPIIPPGQAGILGIGAIAERPVAIGGQVEARPTLPIVLGADHRLVDGDLAEAFKRFVMDELTEPLNLLVGG